MAIPVPSTPPSHKPNPHPYAIKTTSTALLSRSNSSSHTSHPTSHYYVPPSPTPASPAKLKHETPGHRYSRSLNNEWPTPLPTPPRSASSDESAHSHAHALASFDFPVTRLKRSDSIPVRTRTSPSAAPTIEDLPSNPRQWTSAHLSAYLANALRVRSGSGSLTLPADIAVFLRQNRMTGETFLKITEDDLEELGINPLWRLAFLTASRNLRRNILRGRIWSIDTDSPPDSSSPSPSPSPSSCHSPARSSRPRDSLTRMLAHTGGRVRNVVASFEKSRGTGPYENKVVSQQQQPQDATRRRSVSAQLPTSVRTHSRGPSESLSEGHAPLALDRDEDEDSYSSDDNEDENCYAHATCRPAARADAQAARLRNGEQEQQAVMYSVVGEEPTIEALLVSSSPTDGRLWGARAWELDAGPNVTVRHLSERDDEHGRARLMNSPPAWGEAAQPCLVVGGLVARSSKRDGGEVDDVFGLVREQPNARQQGAAEGVEGPHGLGEPTRKRGGETLVTASLSTDASESLAELRNLGVTGHENASVVTAPDAIMACPKDTAEELVAGALVSSPSLFGAALAGDSDVTEAHAPVSGPAISERGSGENINGDLSEFREGRLEAELRDSRVRLDALEKRLAALGRLLAMTMVSPDAREAGESRCESQREIMPGTVRLGPDDDGDVGVGSPFVGVNYATRVLSLSVGKVVAAYDRTTQEENSRRVPSPVYPERHYGFSTYVLLVGIGISSVVLTTILQKVAKRFKI